MAEAKRGGRGHGPQGHGFQRPKDFRGTVKKLLAYIGRYKASLVLVFICLVISSVGSVMSSYLLKPIINDYILPGDFAGLLKMLALLLGLFLLSGLCSYAYARIMVHISQQTVAQLRQDLFDKLQSLPLRYFDTHQSGDLMSRFTNDMDTVSEMINSSFASVVSCALTFIGIVAMMLYMNWLLTLITFAFLVLMLLVVKGVGGRSRVSFQAQQQALGAMNGYIEEMVEGQKVIKVFNHEGKAIEQFAGLNTAYQTAATAAQTYSGAMMPAMANLSRIDYAVTCCVGGLLAIGGMFDVGSLGAYLLYVKQVSQPISQISQQVNVLLAAIAGAERIFAVMEAEPETDEGKTVIVRVEKNGDTLTETSRRTGFWAWKKPDGTLVELRGDVQLRPCDLLLRRGKDGAQRRLPVRQAGAEDRLRWLYRRGQDHHHQPDQPVLRRAGGHHHLRRHQREGHPEGRPCAARWAWCCRIPTCSPAPLPTISAMAVWTPPTRTSARRRGWPTPTASSAICPRGMTRSSPGTAAASARASASCWLSRGRRCPTRRC